MSHGMGVHAGCNHVSIAPGIVYCVVTRVVYIDSSLLVGRISKPTRQHVLQHVAFALACTDATQALMGSDIMAFCMLKPGCRLRGLDGSGMTVEAYLEGVKK